MIAVIGNLFNNSKYTKWYYNIINFRQNNILSKSDLGENHHIIPVSMQGSNKKSNIVRLTYREHFVCHLLLTKMCLYKQHRVKMLWALHRLTFAKKIYHSHQYDLARRIHRKFLIENHHSKRIRDWNKKLSQRTKQSWINADERRASTSARMKENWANNRDSLYKSCVKNSKKAVAVVKERNKNKIEYKGNFYSSWENLRISCGINKVLYKKYYLNGIDPDCRRNKNGCAPKNFKFVFLDMKGEPVNDSHCN